MALTCPFCTSKDIWQPFREGWKDRLLARFGYARAECRGCRRMILLRRDVLEAHSNGGAQRVRPDSVHYVLGQPPQMRVDATGEEPPVSDSPTGAG